MPLSLSAETKSDPTRYLPVIESHEARVARLVREYLAEVKRLLSEQEFANTKMTPMQFLRFLDRLAGERMSGDAVWTKDYSAAAYGRGRAFSSIALGAPLEVRQQVWKKTGMLVEKGQRAFAKMTGDMSADVRRVISEGILKERGQGDMIKAIDELADTYDYAAKRIVRTETMEAVNIGVMDGYRAHEVEKVEWLAAEGCCDRCQALDGRVFRIDGGVSAPLHPNCRCTTVPVIDIPGQEPREAEEWMGDE